MTTVDIIKILIAALLSAFMKPVVEAYIPSKEKLRYFIKKILITTGSYLIPIGILIKTMMYDSPLDKTFVFKTVLFTGLIMMHILMDAFFFLLQRTNNRMNSVENEVERITVLEEAQREHAKGTQEIVKILHRVLDLIEVEKKPLKK